jgi:hypothetical protein
MIYWARFGLGAAAGLASWVVTVLSGLTPAKELWYNTNAFLNGITVALLVYLASYYVLKSVFSSKVEKQSKIMSMGIGIYFFTWIVIWVLAFSIGAGQVNLG